MQNMTPQQALEVLNGVRKQAAVPYDMHAQADMAYQSLQMFITQNSKPAMPSASHPASRPKAAAPVANSMPDVKSNVQTDDAAGGANIPGQSRNTDEQGQ